MGGGERGWRGGRGSGLEVRQEVFDWQCEGGEDGVEQGEQGDEDQGQAEEEIFAAGEQ